MQSTTTPYSSGTESQATSLAGELQRLRYVLQTITGWPNWYRVDLPISLTGTGTHSVATVMHLASRGTLRFPALTLGGDHTTGVWSPAAHHLALGFDATSDQGRFGIGQTNARSWVRMHATAITMHHTLALRYAHSQSGMGNGQYGHVTVLRLTSGSTTNPNSFGFFEGNDQIVLGHSTSLLRVESPVTFTAAVSGAVGSGTWGSRGQWSGTGFTTNGGHVFTLRAHAVTLFDPVTHAVVTTRLNPSDINIDISDITSGNGGGATPNGADRKATFDANSWIHVYWIWHTTGSLLRGVASEKPPTVGPNLPTGFGSWAYSGTVRRGPQDATPLQGTHIMGSVAYLHAGSTALSATSATSETVLDLASFVPPNAGEVLLSTRIMSTGNVALAVFTVRQTSGLNYWNMPIQSATGEVNFDSATTWMPVISQRLFYLWRTDSTGKAAEIDVLGYRVPNGGG